MLDIKNQPRARMFFYALGFSVFESCCYDYDTSNVFAMFLKEVTGSNPAMSVLMDKMLEQNYIVEN